MILLCSVWESMSVSMCAYHEAYLNNEPQECPPEARGGQRSMIPGPSTALQEYWTTEVAHLDDNGVLAKGI